MASEESPSEVEVPHVLERGTVVLLDLEGFMEAVERLPPNESAALLREFGETIETETGASNTVICRAFGAQHMIFFSGPSNALFSLCAVLRIVAHWRREARQRGLRIRPTAALHTDAFLLLNQKAVLGAGLQVVRQLLQAAKEGRVLCSERTLSMILAALPEGWHAEHSRVRHLADHEAYLDTLLPLRAEFEDGIVRILGPTQTLPERAIVLRYCAEVRPRPMASPLPVLTVEGEGGGPSEGALMMAASSISVSPIGRFELQRQLGAGGMGEVWLARDQFSNPVAIKRLLMPGAANSVEVLRLKREAATLSRLSHRNIARIIEVGEQDGVDFIAKESVDGVTLSALLECRGLQALSLAQAVQGLKTSAPGDGRSPALALGSPGTNAGHSDSAGLVLPIPETVELMIRLSEAVHHAHQWGVLHRDLKPQNVMVRPDGDPVVLDFGLAKDIRGGKSELSISSPGDVVGTVEYMAPEQALGSKHASERSDVFSLGAILYRMVTGRKAFTSRGSLTEDLLALQDHEALAPRTFNAQIAQDLAVIVMKCLRREPSDRYESAALLAYDLRQFQRGDPILARPLTLGYRAARTLQRHRYVAMATGIGLLALLVTSVLFTIGLVGEKNRAESALQDLRKTAPAYHANARVLLQAGKFEEALQKFEFALRLDRAAGLVHREYADALLGMQRLQEAAEEYRVALACHDEHGTSEQLEFCQEMLVARGMDRELKRELQQKIAEFLLARGKVAAATPLLSVLSSDAAAWQSVILRRLEPLSKIAGWSNDRLTQQEAGGFALDLSHLDVTDISLLKGLPISDLNLNSTRCASLEGLEGGFLRQLSLDKTSISDLSPLHGMSLRWLRMSSTEVRDLGPLRGMPLKYLDLAGSKKVTDLSPLKGAPLRVLLLTATSVDSLAPLEGMPLTELALGRTSILNLAPLAQMNITDLDLTGIADRVSMKPLSKSNSLRTIFLPQNPVDLLELKNLPALESIGWRQRRMLPPDEFWKRYGPGLAPDHPGVLALALAGMYNPHVGRIETEHDGTLNFYLRGAAFESLAPLKPLPIAELDISHTITSDISTLRGSSVRVLDCRDTEITNLDPLLDCPNLKRLFAPDDIPVARFRELRPDVEIVQLRPRN